MIRRPHPPGPTISPARGVGLFGAGAAWAGSPQGSSGENAMPAWSSWVFIVKDSGDGVKASFHLAGRIDEAPDNTLTREFIG